jgi:hypothetical protein
MQHKNRPATHNAVVNYKQRRFARLARLQSSSSQSRSAGVLVSS